MKSSIAIASLSAMIFAACASDQIPMSPRLLESVSQSQPPARDVADGSRGSIALGGTLEFKQLKIAVLAMTVDSSVAAPHEIASIRLEEGGATEEWTARQGEARNWHGYHVAIAAIHGPGEPGGGRVEVSVATVASLPQCIGRPIGKDSPWPCTTSLMLKEQASRGSDPRLGSIPIDDALLPGLSCKSETWRSST